MICTYLRSSSYNGYQSCAHQYFMEYVLGLESQTNKRAVMGTMVHKALEILAVEKLARQKKEKTYEDSVVGKRKLDSLTADELMVSSYNYYAGKYDYHVWEKADLTECLRLMNLTLDYGDGMFDPRKKEILYPEYFFNIEFTENWAKYRYVLPDDSVIEGHLSIKGTVDLVTVVDKDTIEVTDWKTGQRKNWFTNKKKTYEDLCKDPQLRLYHMALSEAFPQYKTILLTVFFVKDGGPFSIPFTREDIPETKKLIRKRYLAIKSDNLPLLNKGYHCKSFCFFGKNNFPGENKTICESIHSDLKNEGMDKTMEKHMDEYKFVYANPGE